MQRHSLACNHWRTGDTVRVWGLDSAVSQQGLSSSGSCSRLGSFQSHCDELKPPWSKGCSPLQPEWHHFGGLWHCQRGKLGGKRVTCQAKLLKVRFQVDLTYLEAQDEDAEGALSPGGRAGMIKLSFACLVLPSVSQTQLPKGQALTSRQFCAHRALRETGSQFVHGICWIYQKDKNDWEQDLLTDQLQNIHTRLF